MSKKDLVLVVDKPNFVVKLYKEVLEVDLKQGVKKEVEDFLEAKPFLRESLGFLFQTVVPLDVALRDIESVTVDTEKQPPPTRQSQAKVHIIIPGRRDLILPLAPEEAQQLVDKLDDLIPIAKGMEMGI